MLLLGDSFPNYVKEIVQLQNARLWGATIGRLVDFLTFKLPEERLPLLADNVIIHVGTNNINPGTSVFQVASQYKVLLESVKFYMPSAFIFCSAIIPRPCDGQLTKFFIQSCNEVLCILATREKAIFIPSYLPFMHAGQVQDYLYAPADMLHLNGMGLTVLTSLKCLRNRNRLFVHTQTKAEKLRKKIQKRCYPRLP